MARMTSVRDRVRIQELAQQRHTDRQIAAELGWCVATVRKWRRRVRQKGRLGLASRMGRPRTGALGSYPARIRETLRCWRQAHPGWGAKTLRTELAVEQGFQGQRLPARASIARFLKEQRLTRPYGRVRLSALPQPAKATPTAPHEEWQMDARGHERVPQVGVVALIDINDVFSKVKLLSYPCFLGRNRLTRYPNRQDYQLALRLAFCEWGLPDRLAVDHGGVFYDCKSGSPFPTHLHLWLLALGVRLTFARKGRPTDQAMTERSHQTWYQQVLEGQTFLTQQGLHQAPAQRRRFLNESLPCATLEGVPPLLACPEARQPRRLYRPEWEAHLLDLSRVYDYLAQGQWFRKANHVGAVTLGQQQYSLGKHWLRQEAFITFDLQDRQLVFQTLDGQHSRRHPLRGLTEHHLMGELHPLSGFDPFQLALPFTWKDWRVIQLCETLCATT